MSSSWEKFEELVKQEMRKIYSEAAIEHGMNPRNLGELEDADGFAQVTGSCGDTMHMWLKVKDDTISDASFLTDGCGTTIASGSVITELVKGKSIAKARKINQDDVLNALGGLPEESEHCALLATNTLKEAIKDYLAIKKEPWKRAYRKQFGSQA
jgi:nitrogen fixation NifU-like protein